eukprot:7755263-Karenia_brevis.AAC.1
MREDASRFPSDWDPASDISGDQDTKWQYDGYKALAILSQRFDVKARSSMLSSFLKVVSPKQVKEVEIVQGVHQWERRVADLRS